MIPRPLPDLLPVPSVGLEPTLDGFQRTDDGPSRRGGAVSRIGARYPVRTPDATEPHSNRCRTVAVCRPDRNRGAPLAAFDKRC